MPKDTHGTATWTLGQYSQVIGAFAKALPQALADADPKKIIRAIEDGRGLEEKLFRLFREAVSEFPLVFVAQVNHVKGLGPILEKFTWVDPRIRGNNFGIGRTGVVTEEIYLFPFRDCPAPREALDRLQVMGYRGADVVELLTLGSMGLGWFANLDGLVVALGSVCYDRGLETNLYPVLAKRPGGFTAEVEGGSDPEVWNPAVHKIYYAAVKL